MGDLRRNITRVYPNEIPFWGKYIELNNATVPSLGAIQNYQLSKIQEFERKQNAHLKNRHKKLNDLFTSGSINHLISNYESQQEIILNEEIEKILSFIQGTFAGNKTKTKDYNYSLLKQKLELLDNALKQLNTALTSIEGGEGLPEIYLQQVETAMAACDLNSLNPSEIEKWFKFLFKFQGDLIEDIGVAWLNSLNIPNLMTLNVGSLNYQGSGQYGRKGQLIQDLMTFSIDAPQLDKIQISYYTIGREKVTTSLNDFIKTMQQASGQKKQIILDDEGYGKLLELSILNTQAKSGRNQKPWNISASTSVSIGEFAYDDLSVASKRVFELLHSLDNEEEPKGEWVKNSSSDYNLLADYGLATVLSKILHLEKFGNNYLLTPQGFVNFSTRMEQLMREHKSRAHIQGAVTINPTTLGTVYTVGMTNIK